MKNRNLCLALGLSALATVGFAKKEQKNVLFILVDDMQKTSIHAYGKYNRPR